MEVQKLRIYTPNLKNQIDFYSNTIGLKVVEQAEHEATFLIGKSRLKLIENKAAKPYHFAINIPCNKEEEALAWLKERVEILKDKNQEIQDFDFWNAKAIYFYDRDQNIVELIARKNLKNQHQAAFGIDSLLNISEIGAPVRDIKAAFCSINQITGIQVFDGNFKRFCAVGDELGLFIFINKNVKDWFPTGDKAYSSEFEISIKLNETEYELEFKNEEIQLAASVI